MPVNKVKRFLDRGLGVEALDTSVNDRLVRWALIMAASAVAIRLFFWWYTGRVWEDALISVLHSENCADGLGLTHYRVGERPVHGFTSPLSVLIPLMADLVRVGWGLPWLKLVSAFAGGLTVLYVTAISIHPRIRLAAPLAVMVMAYVAFEHHQILWGTSGMETQLATLALVMSLYYTIAVAFPGERGEDGSDGASPSRLAFPKKRGEDGSDGASPSRQGKAQAIRLGVALALCMLARPDFAFWTVIAGLCVFVRDRRQFLWVAGVALALYLPWLVFTTVYYGSPIPNTIVAKGLGYPLWSRQPDLALADVGRNVWTRINGRYLAGSIFQPLGPSFAGHGTHFSHVVFDRGRVCQLMTVLALVGAVAALRRKQWVFTPLVVFVLAYGAYYVCAVPIVFAWYVIPFVVVVLLLSARGLEAVTGPLADQRLRNIALGFFACLYLTCLLGILPRTFYTEKRIQEDIENNVRKRAAIHLAELMKENETVGCEALGYLSYCTRRTVYDWPGLGSRRVVEFSRRHPDRRTLADMLDHLRPDYILLRPFEYDQAKEQDHDWLDTDYALVQRFEAPPEQIADIMLLSRNIDVCFLLFEKRTNKSVGKIDSAQRKSL